MRNLGFTVEPAMLQTQAPDQAVRKAAQQAGLGFVQVTDSLRRQATAAAFYFPLDGTSPRGAPTRMPRWLLPKSRLFPDDANWIKRDRQLPAALKGSGLNIQFISPAEPIH